MSNEKKEKKAYKVVINVILCLFLAFALLTTVLAISSTQSGDGVPSIFGYSLMKVESDSMEPTIKTGDLIFIRLLDEDEKEAIKKDDIITFVDTDLSAQTNTLIFNTHRVHEVINNDDGSLQGCITWGDNRTTCPIPDTTTRAKADIRGVFEGGRLPYMGKVLNYLTTSTGFLICVLLPLLLVFIYEIIDVVRSIIKVRNKDKKVISVEDEELIKQKAIEDFLRSQAAAQADEAPAEAPAETPAEAPAETTEE